VRGTREQILEWERRWAAPVAIATFLAVALLIGSQAVSSVSGNGSAEILRSANEHSGSVALTGLMQAVAFTLLVAPLFYLFRAVEARSNRVRSQLIGLVIAAPIFLGVSSGLTIGARGEAADQFVAGEAKSTLSAKEAREECVSDREDEGAEDFAKEFEPSRGESALAACEDRKIEDDEASNAVGEASLTPVVSGLGIAGGLGFAIALLYSGLWAMRTGLFSRFWGALAMVAGIAFLLGPLFFVTLVWFVYFGSLVIGKIPGGRPPAWAAGEAIPWPTPGEKAAAEMAPSDPEAIDVDATEISDSSEDGAEKRKRKQRD
jgi:hypothetical protein